jgi:4-amino-4-deoxy-L-arabinose transferase-like glycosyltransferase
VSATGEWIQRIADGGIAAVTQSAVDHAFGAIHTNASFPVVVGGYLWASIGRALGSSGGEALRSKLGFLAIAAAASPLFYAFARSALGRRAALLGALLLSLAPAFAIDAASSARNALAVTAWLLVLGCYVRTRGKRRVLWGVATGLTLGLALATSLDVVLLPAAVALHFVVAHPSLSGRSLRRANVLVPAPLLWMVALSPAIFALLSPWLWYDTAARARAVVLHVDAPAAPAAPASGLPASWPTLAWALLGLVILCHGAIVATGRQGRAMRRFSALVLVCAFAGAVEVTVLGNPFGLLPWITVAAAVGIDAVIERIDRAATMRWELGRTARAALIVLLAIAGLAPAAAPSRSPELPAKKAILWQEGAFFVTTR